MSRSIRIPFGNSEPESQRDSIIQRRVGELASLPWVNAATMLYPNGVASSR
jgi:hypothetical protein